MALYLKWFTMADLGGFEKARRAAGYLSLGLTKSLGFFEGEIFVGLFLIPAFLLLVNRYLLRIRKWFPAVFTSLFTIAWLALFTIQNLALEETGRFISLRLMRMAVDFGLAEPDAIRYIPFRNIALLALALAAVIAATIVCARRIGHAYSPSTLHAARLGGEFWILALVLILALGWKGTEFRTPYHQDTFRRAFVSLWREKAVETGEFSAFNLDELKQLKFDDLDSLSSAELISRYRQLANPPAPDDDPRYFAKEQGDNVLFFILETMPDEFLPANDDLSQFPSLRRLREHSFIGDRHYASFPFTQYAVFSLFTSWYPIDTFHINWGGSADQIAPGLVSHLNELGYHSATFSPLPINTTDDVIHTALGFQNRVYLNPTDSLPQVTADSDWEAHRIAADLATLNKLKSAISDWTSSNQKFVAAYLPQLGHFPYTRHWQDQNYEEIRSHARAIVARDDAWLGEMLDLLQHQGQLDHTIIVVLGDHGRRNIRENPNLRRGTIDETAFHVPLFIYAPRALDHTEHIASLTSHIDIAPTVLDLLGVQRNHDTEQGTAIWNPGLRSRTTFFFAQPLLGADGYYSRNKFFMEHYYSDMVYESPTAVFQDSNFAMRGSPVDKQVRATLRDIVNLQPAWQKHFAIPAPTPR